MPASAITRFPANRRNAILERLSANSRRLRGGIGVAGAIDLTKRGRSSALEQLAVRLGVIPIVTIPTPGTPGNVDVQAFAPRRPAGTETVTVSGGTTPQTFVTGDPMKATAATAGTVVLTATDSVDASATGRAIETAY